MKREVLLFAEGGPQNTEATLRAARARAEQLGLKRLVLASSTGATLLKALDEFEGAGVEVIGVTLGAGLWKVYEGPDGAALEEARRRGGKVLTATHSLMGNVEAAVREKFGGLPPVELIAQTYYTFCRG